MFTRIWVLLRISCLNPEFHFSGKTKEWFLSRLNALNLGWWLPYISMYVHVFFMLKFKLLSFSFFTWLQMFLLCIKKGICKWYLLEYHRPEAAYKKCFQCLNCSHKGRGVWLRAWKAEINVNAIFYRYWERNAGQSKYYYELKLIVHLLKIKRMFLSCHITHISIHV